jgi:lysozyme family protein
MRLEKALELVGIREGGYSNDPNDPGGETNHGISKRSYPELDIKNLLWEDAVKLYERDFWLAPKISYLPDPLQFSVFDFAINSGPTTAIGYLQRMLKVADDGILGPITLEALETDPLFNADKWLFTAKYNALRLSFMTKLKNWPVHGKGWANRIAKNILEIGVIT